MASRRSGWTMVNMQISIIIVVLDVILFGFGVHTEIAGTRCDGTRITVSDVSWIAFIIEYLRLHRSAL